MIITPRTTSLSPSLTHCHSSSLWLQIMFILLTSTDLYHFLLPISLCCTTRPHIQPFTASQDVCVNCSINTASMARKKTTIQRWRLLGIASGWFLILTESTQRYDEDMRVHYDWQVLNIHAFVMISFPLDFLLYYFSWFYGWTSYITKFPFIFCL